MTLYHRTFTRIPLVLEVELQFKGENLGNGLTRDINPFGVFIELSKPELVTNDFVKMHFNNKDENHNHMEQENRVQKSVAQKGMMSEGIMHHCSKEGVAQKGMVIHCSKEGVGIIFASDTEEFRMMLDQAMTRAGTTAVGNRIRH